MAITQELLALIPAIYDTALDPRQWGFVLERLTDAIGGHHATIMWGQSSGDAQFITHGYSADVLRDAYVPIAASNIFADRAMRAPQGTVESDLDVLPKSEFRASEFYKDFLIKYLDADAILTGMLWRDRDTLVALNICRNRHAGAFSQRDKRRLNVLMPHFARAIAIGNRLGSLENCARTAHEMVHQAPCGAIVTDKTGHVIYANRRGELLLQQGDAISASSEGLRAATPALTANLRCIIAKATAGEGGAIALRSPSVTLYGVAVPLGVEFGWLRAAPGRVLLMLTEPNDIPALPLEYLRDLFKLTIAEARLATILQQGKTLAQAASILAISKHTGRVHLNALLSKTGTHRQSELMRLLMALPRTLSAGEALATSPSPNV
ncbi:MAG TPA: helix-turn-helix transcriptional regulator [Rhizomicrobium sp.]|jgi:DNA-binding CsgD family transcriptional regulator